MRLFYWGKDGGPESTTSGLWLIELKKWFSVVLLRFDGASREAFHTHAFNSVSWLLKGMLTETMEKTGKQRFYTPSIFPIITKRDTFHKVDSQEVSWALSFRGPWVNNWREFLETEGRYRTLTHGRKEVDETPDYLVC